MKIKIQEQLLPNIVVVNGKKPKAKDWLEKTTKLDSALRQIENGTASGVGCRTGRVAGTSNAIICINFNNSLEMIGDLYGGLRIKSPRTNSLKVLYYLNAEDELYDLLKLDDDENHTITIATPKGELTILKGIGAQAVIGGKYLDEKSKIEMGKYEAEGDCCNYYQGNLVKFLNRIFDYQETSDRIQYVKQALLHLGRLGDTTGILGWLKASLPDGYQIAGDWYAKRTRANLQLDEWNNITPDLTYDPYVVLAETVENDKTPEDDFSCEVLAYKCLNARFDAGEFSSVFKRYFKNQLVFESVYEDFWIYEGGIFVEKTETQIRKIIRDVLKIVDEERRRRFEETKEKHYEKLSNRKFINELLAYLKEDTVGQLCSLASRKNLIPMKDFVLSLRGNTPEIIPHSPAYGFTFKLPYNYDKSATCPEWLKFLNFALKGEYQDESISLLRAYFLMILLRIKGHDRFVEVVGKPRTGKSTIANVATALVGSPNTYPTDIEDLEKGRFSPAEFVEKTLVCVREIHRWKQPTKRLQNIISSDAIKTEKKSKQKMPGKVCLANLLLCGNEPLYSSDASGALNQRRITIWCNNLKPSHERVILLQTVDNTEQWEGLFANELPGIFNWVINQDFDIAYQMVLSADSLESQKTSTAEVFREGSAVEQFVADCVVANPDNQMAVGIARMKRNCYGSGSNTTRVENTTPLYHYFEAYCNVNKITRIHQPKQFRKALEATLTSMHIPYEYRRTKEGYRFFLIDVNETAITYLNNWILK